jgi:hypothetical protein
MGIVVEMFEARRLYLNYSPEHNVERILKNSVVPLLGMEQYLN